MNNRLFNLFAASRPAAVFAADGFARSENDSYKNRIQPHHGKVRLFACADSENVMLVEAAFECRSCSFVLPCTLKGFPFMALASGQLGGRTYVTCAFAENEEDAVAALKEAGREKLPNAAFSLAAALADNPAPGTDIGLTDMAEAAEVICLRLSRDYPDLEVSVVSEMDFAAVDVSLSNIVRLMALTVETANNISLSRKLEMRLCRSSANCELRAETVAMPEGLERESDMLRLAERIAETAGAAFHAEHDIPTGKAVFTIAFGEILQDEVDFKYRDQYAGLEEILANLRERVSMLRAKQRGSLN